MRTSLSSVCIALALGLTACADGLESGLDLSPDGASPPDRSSTVELEPNTATDVEDMASVRSVFDRAEDAYDVPADLLIALSLDATSHQMVQGEVEFEGQIPTWGVMALRDDLVDEAADLAGVSVDEALFERDANVYAAAALLSAWADEDPDLDRADIDAWAPLIVRYSGIEEELAQSSYVHDQVYGLLREGAQIEGMALTPRKVAPDFPVILEPQHAAGADRSYARWRPSPNNSARPSGSSGKPSMVIIHTCEGSYAGCWGWLRNTASRASAHYVVNSTGSEVTQLVRESRKAWHISATYQCSRNSSTDCWRNGSSSNNFTVGIEHAGYASQRSWSPGLLDTSARLTCDITKTHGIPRDSYHIVGHGQLQPYNRTDPGKNWPWSSYISKVKAKCGGSSGGGGGASTTKAPSGTRVIDSNNARNDTANQKIVVSSAWTSSASVGGYHGTGYWWRSVGASSDGAEFRFRNDKSACYTVQAWWPAASDRSRRAPFIMFDSAGKRLDTVYVDQRSQHARWVTLGEYDWPKGWNTVALSRWTDSGKVVVADAVRLVPSTGCPGASKPAIDLVVDNTNSRNDTSKAKAVVGSSWTGSRYTAGYYGSNYAWGSTEAVSDPFSFQFKLDTPRRVTIKARWTAGGNRSSAAPYQLWSPSGTLLDTVKVDQTRNHARWVTLGTYSLPAGWNRVDLSRWAPSGKVVVADAIRIQSAD